jgi:hypothetical protein
MGAESSCQKGSVKERGLEFCRGAKLRTELPLPVVFVRETPSVAA